MIHTILQKSCQEKYAKIPNYFQVLHRFLLFTSASKLESRMAKGFDPALSRKLDCVIFLIEN